MKPVTTGITETDNLDGEVVDFSISDPRWVMRSMADLYSNRELAVIREYSTNAFDASVELANKLGKKPEPIKVTLPSRLNPYFTVQDFGIGMSETELKEIYTKFGTSTKRESNDFNGMLGFGCKSAVAYTNTFTVTSVKDGKKTIAVISRREDYSITLKVVVPSAPTSEPSGTTVQVPVHNTAEFEQKARDFYCFWKPGTVLVNGSEPKSAVGEKIGDGLYYTDGASNSYVVMGNVAYKVENPQALFKKISPISFVMYVANGDVEFTPAREGLKYSDHTKKALHRIIDNFEQNAIKNARDEVTGAPTHADALRAWTKWTNTIGSVHLGVLKYKGDHIVDIIKVKHTVQDYIDSWGRNQQNINYEKAHHYTASASWNAVRETYNVNVHNVLNGMVILGSPVSIGTEVRRRAKEFANKKGLKANHFYFLTQDSFDSVWVEPARVVQWEKVKAETPKPKRPKSTSVGYGRKAGSFDTISQSGWKGEQDVPAAPVYYISTQEYNHRGASNVKYLLSSFGIKNPVVIVPANRKDKFLRNYKTAQPVLDFLATKVNLDGPSLIPNDYKQWCAIYDDVNVLARLNPQAIDDPALKSDVELARKYDNTRERQAMQEYEKHQSLANMIGRRQDFKSWRNPRQIHSYNRSRPLEVYPLAQNKNVLPRHVEFYINSVYAAHQAGNRV